MYDRRTRSRCLLALILSLVTASALIAADTADPSSERAAKPGPVKVYILSGQSNMVGIGQVTGGSTRWGDEFIDPVLSVYPGAYDPATDYDAETPSKTVKLASFGGVEPEPFPGGGLQIVRGHIRMKATGVYEFDPGYGASTENIMQIGGKEVYRKEPGKDAVRTPVKLTADEKVPFKIIYLNDQANGLGWYSRADIPGTLTTIVKSDGKFKYLVDKDGNWVSRDDVWYKGVVTAGANMWLAPGCGASPNSIGPELGFGHLVGDFHEEPVLILKASQGNRSLGWDFLPPGSERYEAEEKDARTGEVKTYVYAGYQDSPDRWIKGTEPKPVDWYAGKQYDDCFGAAKEVLANFDTNFPQWKGRGYEIAGFGWWQGHKDTGSAVHAARYEQNLVRLIESLRKDFNAPSAPFVVAIGCGNPGREGTGLQIANAQLAVSGASGKHPQFKGNVLTVETRDFLRAPEVSPRDQGFHYNQNAETYMLVGEAMGKGMLELLKAKE